MTERQEQLAQAAVSGELKDGAHLLYARIYYADTDFSGFVYHGRYLEFYERGRTDFCACRTFTISNWRKARLAKKWCGSSAAWRSTTNRRRRWTTSS